MTNGNRINLSGQRFGRLYALRDVGPGASGSRLWYCVCDCGGRKIAQCGNLRAGQTGSCGCLLLDNARSLGRAHGTRNLRMAHFKRGDLIERPLLGLQLDEALS